MSAGLTFSARDRDTNVRRIAFVADLLSRNGVPVITAAISPYKEIRDEARELMGDRFVEVYVEASVDTCAERDVKGLYAKAFSGDVVAVSFNDRARALLPVTAAATRALLRRPA